MKLAWILFATVLVATSAASAQSSTSGTASGSTAPNQLGTPLETQNNTDVLGSPGTVGRGPGTFGTLENADVGPEGNSIFMDESTTNRPSMGTTSGTTTGATGSTANTSTPLYYLIPSSTGQSIPSNAVPVYPQQQFPQSDGTVSGTTSGPTNTPSFVTPTASPSSF